MYRILRHGQPVAHKHWTYTEIRKAKHMIGQITRFARQDQQMTQKQFAEAICEHLFGIEVSNKAINHWESGRQTPGYILLYAVLASYRDWRHDWALGCLEVLRPDIWKKSPESTTEER